MKLKVFLFTIPLMLVGCGSLMFWTEKKDDFDFKRISEMKKKHFRVPNTAPVIKHDVKSETIEVRPIPEPTPIHVKPGERA